MRAGLGDARTASVAELGVGRAGRLVLSLSLWALLLLRLLLEAHLLHLALSHQLGVVVLRVGGSACSVHVRVMLSWG